MRHEFDPQRFRDFLRHEGQRFEDMLTVGVLCLTLRAEEGVAHRADFC
jgi:hypothetical protein